MNEARWQCSNNGFITPGCYSVHLRGREKAIRNEKFIMNRQGIKTKLDRVKNCVCQKSHLSLTDPFGLRVHIVPCQNM